MGLKGLERGLGKNKRHVEKVEGRLKVSEVRVGG